MSQRQKGKCPCPDLFDPKLKMLLTIWVDLSAFLSMKEIKPVHPKGNQP